MSGGGAAAPPRLVTVSIDGREFRVEEGRNMLDVALSLGFDLPFFCWHPVLGSIGACRQCAVRLYWTDREGRERSGIAMACMTEAQEGTRIEIDDDEAIRFRAQMIELMMLSHPHDCPVCDEGGECHLQDMTVMTGHSYRRYRGRKRTHVNQDLGPFVTHELNRCITCYRCVRFYCDYAGGRDFAAFGLRNQVYFGRAADGPLESEFSGNLAEVCPTGVFDDKPFAERSVRKWDLQTAPSVCPHCGLGCTTTPGARNGELRRVLARFNPDVNKMFLCDRGRYGHGFVNAAARVRTARVRSAGEDGGAAGADAALDAAAELLAGRRAVGIGSPRASLEANFALRTLVGAERFYLGMSDGDYDLVGAVIELGAEAGLRLGALADVHDADAVVVLGEDLTNTAPMLDLTLRTWLRLRPSAEEDRTHIRRWNDSGIGRAKRRAPSALWLATTHETKLDIVAADAWRAAPDDLARLALALAHEVDTGAPRVTGFEKTERERLRRWAAALREARAPLVVAGCSSGSPALLRAAAALTRALARAAARPDAAHAAAGKAPPPPGGKQAPATLVVTVPEADSLGLRLMGGGRLSQALAAVARGEADTVVVLDNDLDRRTPALLIDDLLRRRPAIVALATLEDRVAAHADVVLPAATFAEETGTFVNHEGRAQRYFAVLPPSGDVRPAWRWVRALLDRLHRKDALGWETVDDVIAALEHELPRLRGVAAAAPAASWRAGGRKVARQPLRATGRTAVDAARTVREPAPTDDPDSALAFSLEGLAPLQSPAALRARSWAPGWNSGNNLHKFDQELAATRPAQSSGARLLDGAPRRPTAAPPAPPARFAPRPDEFTLVAVHRIFGSDDLSLYSPAVASRAASAFLALGPADAARLGARDGDALELWLPWMSARLQCRLMDSLPPGTAGLPLGVPGAPYISLPARARISRLEGQP